MSEKLNAEESNQASKETNSTGYEVDETTQATDTTGNEDGTTTVESVDEFGYKKEDDSAAASEDSKPDEKETTEDSKTDDKKEDEVEEVEEEVTGYENEPSDEDEKKSDEKSEEDSEKSEEEAKKLEKEISEVVKKLPEGYNKEKVVEFAKENGLSKEQVEAYVEMESQAHLDYVQAQEEAKVAQRKEWFNELKNDVEFSGQNGENFNLNVKKVNNIVENYFPNVKKTLTERGGMLPPYIMRDFLALYKNFNPTSTFGTGEPPKPEADNDGNYLDVLYK